MSTATTPTEADILEQVVAPHAGNFTPQAARALLAFAFDRAATTRIRRLLQKNNRGTITTEERLTLERYLRVGHLLDPLHAKARVSLEEAGTSC